MRRTKTIMAIAPGQVVRIDVSLEASGLTRDEMNRAIEEAASRAMTIPTELTYFRVPLSRVKVR